jgi:hypothetical protein
MKYKDRGEVAFTGPAKGERDKHSSLIEDSNVTENHKQPQGKSIEAGTTDVAEHHKGSTFGGVAHSFKPPAANEAHGYGHSIMERKGPLRMSGVKGAHRVGHRSK